MAITSSHLSGMTIKPSIFETLRLFLNYQALFLLIQQCLALLKKLIFSSGVL